MAFCLRYGIILNGVAVMCFNYDLTVSPFLIFHFFICGDALYTSMALRHQAGTLQRLMHRIMSHIVMGNINGFCLLSQVLENTKYHFHNEQ